MRHTVPHEKPPPKRKVVVIEFRVLGSDETVPVEVCTPLEVAGMTAYQDRKERILLPAFRNHVVAVAGSLPDPADEEFAELALTWVAQVRSHDWSGLRGQTLEGDEDWVDLRTTMVRVGWGVGAANRAWRACVLRPYSRPLPTAAGWAAAGWVVPAAPDEAEPAFAQPVLEARGLLRWTYITRWEQPVDVPDSPPPHDPDPEDDAWADVLSRLRQDHYAGDSLTEAIELATDVLSGVGLGPRDPLEAEDEPLPDRHLAESTTHAAAVVRQAAWFLLRAEADAWMACTYGECQHHWAVEAEEDAYEMDEVLELAGYGVTSPVDAAYIRRRLLTMAFGDINDVPLAGAGDLSDFVDFYTDWVAGGRSEDELAAAAETLRGDDPPASDPPASSP